MKIICPSCKRDIVKVDGEEMTFERIWCNGGDGDTCADGNLYCLNCLLEEKCPCSGREVRLMDEIIYDWGKVINK